MPYYGQGDYYGQGGFMDILGTVAKGVTGFVTGGPAGAAAAVLGPKLFGGGGARPGGTGGFMGPLDPRRISIRPGAMLPGGMPGVSIDPVTGMPRRKRRRMNYTNVKALRRANRRMDGFVRETRKVLKHTNYKLVTKGSGSRRAKKEQPQVVVETGSGSVRT